MAEAASEPPARPSHPAFDAARRQVFVVGNEAADVDSLVSAYAMAQLLDSEEVEGVPLAQIPREEFRLRGDALKLFKEAGSSLTGDGSPVQLRFWDDVDWDVVRALGRRGLVLTDHNKMTPKVAACFDAAHVEWLLDHHADTRSYPEARCDLDEGLGSACTLVGEQFAAAARAVPPELGPMLAGVILLDTRNFDPKENKGTPRDGKALEQLAAFVPAVGQDAWYAELVEARKDVSHLSIKELMLLDMKVAPVDGFDGKVAFCSMFSTLDGSVAKAGGAGALHEAMAAFAAERGYASVVAFFAKDGEGFRGLAAVPAASALVEAMIQRLDGAPKSLSAELRENALFAAQGILEEGFGLQVRAELAPLQGYRMRGQISRKTLLPCACSAGAGEAAGAGKL